ncbi:MAG: hypothetical protein QNK40_00115 [Desulfobacterales bacterium]|nr:hypothetical protein [Desulfobacterales bacterium]
MENKRVRFMFLYTAVVYLQYKKSTSFSSAFGESELGLAIQHNPVAILQGRGLFKVIYRQHDLFSQK